MRQFSVLESGSRAAAQPVASCSYPTPPSTSRRIQHRQTHACGWGPDQSAGRRRLAAPATLLAPHLPADNSRPSIACAAGEDVISGYTPANYISFSEHPADVAGHGFSVVVDAPTSVCFGIWNDWNRLVEFLDLVAQIGLDPKNPDMALFQTFYRHGLLPVMEIVFVLQKTQVVENERIEFESVWGMPMSGSVSFRPLDGAAGSRTEVTLEFAQALPTLLVDLKVGVFGVQNSLRPILSENLVAFKELAEELAAAEGAQKGKGGQGARPRPEAGDRQYLLFDERADVQAYAAMIDMLDDAAVRQQEQAAADEERERAAAAAAALSQQESVPAAGVPAGQQGPGTEAAGTAPAGGRARAGRATRRTTRTTTDAAGGPAVAGRGASDAAAAAGQGQGQGPDDRSSGRKRSVRSTRGAS